MEHGGNIEPVTRRSLANAKRVQLIIHALSDRFTGDPFPARSDHSPFKVEVPVAATIDVYRCAPSTPYTVDL